MRPSLSLVILLVLWAVVGMIVSFGWLDIRVWWAVGSVITFLSLIDAVSLQRSRSPTVTRDMPAVLPVGVPREVGLHLRSQSKMKLRVDVHDHVPGQWISEGLPQTLQLRPGLEHVLHYSATPAQRGSVDFSGVDVRLHSPLGLWRDKRHLPVAQTLRVYPNFAPLAKFALFSAEQATRAIGAHLRRRRGEGTEFHQMREYRLGDSMRQIDWKATARARKLISRDYQEEKNQQIILMLDTGRRMLAQDGTLSHFDHVLNASLVVSYLALRQGDAVGMYASGGDSRWMAPQRGLGTVDTMLNTLYDLHAQPVATDYLAAATQLSIRHQRRTFVMWVTNVRDEDIEEMLAAVKLLQKRHLVCVASLRETVLDTELEKPINNFDDALKAGALARYLEDRTRAHTALRAQGVHVLDVTCTQLPSALVEHYLAIKRSGLL
jgi:uncharacterized protein (DUF58 family)